LKEYLEANQEEPKGEAAIKDQKHETSVHGNLNTIAGGFFEGESSASILKRYAGVVIPLDTRIPDHPPKPTLYFVGSDLEDVFPHEMI